jgi:hypothetical protein
MKNFHAYLFYLQWYYREVVSEDEVLWLRLSHLFTFFR